MKLALSFLCTLFLVIQCSHCQNTKYKIRTIAFYNVENLFDTINNPDTFDDDFTPKGKNHYNSKIYWDKIDNISTVISQIGIDKTHTGPALIGLAEIENRSVLEDLVRSKNLVNSRYQIIHFDSPDQRGIDVALLYQEKYFMPTNQEKFELKLWDASGLRIFTRDILLVSGLLDNELIHIIINHWPSRRGGQVKSNPKREKAAYLTQQIIEALNLENEHAKIIVMGDFNDDPGNHSIKTGLQASGDVTTLNKNSLYNPMATMYRKGLNTLGYRDGLHLFDQIMLSTDWISFDKNYKTFKFYNAGIFNPALIITQKGRYKGYPFRSFQRNHYTGGYSDHYPVYIYLIKKEN
ncbi:MAG: endonuclease/exonuclease/phosphatase family protein [Flavobacteriaceae bacterium]|nr:endonuclease/exonuclease/phosphatase family protein [Flavobacteriaceae bacterium]